jgi:DUF971 family protein
MTPSKIQLHKQSKRLELHFAQDVFQLDAEYLRVHSPSAEVKGHGPGQEVLQFGKQNVGINGLAAVGNYALKIEFDDGHDSGIYSWEYLHKLATQKQQLWQQYLDKLKAADKHRDIDVQTVKFIEL